MDYLYISDTIKTHDGFVDALRATLYAAEKHGVAFGQAIADKESQIRAANKYLPDYTLTRQADINCFIIKKSVVDLFGTPDKNLRGESLQKALEDYLRKINKFGICALVSHKALYSPPDSHEAMRSPQGAPPHFTRDPADKDARAATADKQVCPMLPFLPLLDDEYYPKKRILFDCSLLYKTHTGTSEVTLATYSAFHKLYKDKYDIFILADRGGDEFHKLSERFGNVIYPDTIDEMFHLVYAPNQLMSFETQRMLGSHCLKITQLMHDIMMLRIDGHFPIDIKSNTDLGVKLSDGIAFVSEFSRDDFLAYYAGDISFDEEKTKLKVIYNAKEPPKPIKNKYELPFDDFCLVAGNAYKHKAISETIDVIKNTDKNYIVIGGESGAVSENIYSYKSGRLEDDFINCLYAKCKALIFPSMYEGFGLPTLMGLMNGKRVILNDNAINREIQNRYSHCKDSFIFFKKFEEIADIIETIDLSPQSAQRQNTENYTWETAAAELESFFSEILDEETDAERLRRRLWFYEHIENRASDMHIEGERKITRQFGSYKLREMLRFAVKEHIKQRRPKLFKRLKGD